MSLFRHTFRLECDSSRISEVVDQVTGLPMAPVIGETSEFQIALFQGGVLVPKTNITSIIFKFMNAQAETLIEWINSGTDLNGSLTVGAWRRGVDYMTAFVMSDTESLEITAGPVKLIVQAVLNSSPTGQTGVVNFASIDVDLVAAPDGSVPSTPPSGGPPTAYTKAESDARFAPLADSATLLALGTEVDAVETWLGYTPGTPIKFVSAGAAQAFSTAEKAQARTNIQAALLQSTDVQSLAGSYVPTPAVHSRWQITLTGNSTFEDAATIPEWTPGKIYELVVTQDATGGRSLAFGSLYIFPTYAAIDPQPSATTRLFLRWEFNNVRVWEAEPVAAPFPDFMLHAARNTTAVAGVYTKFDDVIANLPGTTALSGTPSATMVHGNLNGRAAATLSGTRDIRFTGPKVGFVTGGATFAGVFSSTAGGSPQFLACFPTLGLEVAYNAASGLYISGVAASAGNRVALAFTPNEGTAKVFIGTLRGSGGGMALDQSGARAYNSGGTMSAPTASAAVSQYIGSDAGVSYWNGMLNQVLLFSRGLTWPEMVALRRQLSLEIGI